MKTCLYCGEKPPRRLMRNGYAPMFCTVRCAARHGQSAADLAEAQWCKTCEQWHNHLSPYGSGCPEDEGYYGEA